LFILLTDSPFDNLTFDVDRLGVPVSVSVERTGGVGDTDRTIHSSEDVLLLLLSRSILREIINDIEFVFCLKQRSIELHWLFKKQRILYFP
jgi:hypothetical protein